MCLDLRTVLRSQGYVRFAVYLLRSWGAWRLFEPGLKLIVWIVSVVMMTKQEK